MTLGQRRSVATVTPNCSGSCKGSRLQEKHCILAGPCPDWLKWGQNDCGHSAAQRPIKWPTQQRQLRCSCFRPNKRRFEAAR